MEIPALLLVAIAVLGFGLVSARAQRSIVTPPMVFVFLGLVLGQYGLGLINVSPDDEWIHLLAEVTLVVVLFTDASRIDLSLLRRQHGLPVRLLLIGLPLTILLGTVVGAAVFSELSFLEVALLAAILAPTDAALGQAVVSSKKIPVRIRQTLNVESGLNDGIALPVVLILLSLACGVEQPQGLAYWVKFAVLQVTLGPLVGIVVGFVGGKMLELASRTEWMNRTFQDLAALALAILAFAAAEMVHGNGFIAAFCAGLTLGNTSRVICTVYEFAESEGQLLILMVFTIFGATMVPTLLEQFDPRYLLYGVLSLTVVRIIPVAVSLAKSRLKPQTVLFIGWFGPRGIASILFTLVVVGDSPVGHEELFPIVTMTVLLSVFAHGMTATPGASSYSLWTAKMRDDKSVEENVSVGEMPVRFPQSE